MIVLQEAERPGYRLHLDELLLPTYSVWKSLLGRTPELEDARLLFETIGNPSLCRLSKEGPIGWIEVELPNHGNEKGSEAAAKWVEVLSAGGPLLATKLAAKDAHLATREHAKLNKWAADACACCFFIVTMLIVWAERNSNTLKPS